MLGSLYQARLEDWFSTLILIHMVQLKFINDERATRMLLTGLYSGMVPWLPSTLFTISL